MWKDLRSIPVGETRTYGEIAQRIGLTKEAVHAIGKVCTTNAVALVLSLVTESLEAVETWEGIVGEAKGRGLF